MIVVLALNCFQDTIVTYRVQQERLIFTSNISDSLLSVDQQSCRLFKDLQTQMFIRIGDLIFQSHFQTYNGPRFSFTLRIVKGNLNNISKYSVASFILKTMDNQIEQQGTVTQFRIQRYNRSNCFVHVNLLHNQSSNKILVDKTKQKSCQFETDGAVSSQVWYNDSGEMIQLMKTSLPTDYNDWFINNETCYDENCLTYMDKLVASLFPKSIYQVEIQQKFKKKVKQFDEAGNTVEVEVDFDQNLILRQQVNQLGSEYQIPSVSEIELRPLYQSIQITQKVDDGIKFEFTAPYDLFMITVCISSNGLPSGRCHCFTKNSTEVHLTAFNIIVCEDNAEMTMQECLDKLFEISNFPDSIQGYIYYETLQDDQIQQQYTYDTQIQRNQYSKIILSVQNKQACLMFNIKDGYRQKPMLQSIIVQWDVKGRQNSIENIFVIPNEEDMYCYPTENTFQNDHKSQQYTVQIGSQINFVNNVIFLQRLKPFYFGFIAFICLLCVEMLILLIFIQKCNKKYNTVSMKEVK